MDRSFLLQKEVIEASRDFVCIRLATYEDQEEADYLVQVFRGRLGTLENTVFAIMSPDAKIYLAQPGRSPNFAFRDAKDMAEKMKKMAAAYKPAEAVRKLPAMKDFRISLNVAACDNVPLVVAVSDDKDEQQKLNEKLAKAAWSKKLIGSYEYSPAAATKALADAKIPAKPGIYVINPSAYGDSGKVLAQLDTNSDEAALTSGLKAALTKFNAPSKEAMSHINKGHQTGVFWQTKIPVTDPGPPR